MEILILSILLEKPMHGYGVISTLAEITGFEFSPGAIYPLLYKLEKLELVRSKWKQIGERKRIKLYELTENGRKILDKLRDKLRVVLRE